MQETTIVIALGIGGATLAAMGALRVRGSAFRDMPAGVALAILAGGLAVMAFGVVLLVSPEPGERPTARATLEPVAPSERGSRARRGVAGRVVTASGRGVADKTVTLRPLFEGEPLEEKTDDDGSFAFDGVKVDPGSPYVAEVSHDGARFSSEVLRSARDEAYRFTIVVASTTSSTDDLVVTAESLAVVGDEAGLQAVHALNVDNGSRRAYVAEFELPLLRGAAAIQEGPGLDRRRLDLRGNAMISRAPVLPGTHDFSYTYVSQMSKDGTALSRRVTLPTKRYELLVAGDLAFEPGRGLREHGEVSLGPRDAQRTYKRFVATDLRPGDAVTGRIAVASGSGAIRVAAPIAAVVVAIALVAFGISRRRRTAVEPAPEPEPAPTT